MRVIHQPGQPWQGSHHLGLVASLTTPGLVESESAAYDALDDLPNHNGMAGAIAPDVPGGGKTNHTPGAHDGDKSAAVNQKYDVSSSDGALADEATPGEAGEVLADALAEARGGDYSLLPSMRSLLALCARYMPIVGLELIYDAFQTAAKAHEGVKRKTGEPYIEHPIAVATLLAELALDAEGIAAALLHDTVEDTDLSVEELRAHFGDAIAMIVDGVTKFTVVEAPTPSARSQLPAHSDVILPDGSQPAAPSQSAEAPLSLAETQARRERKARQQVETFNKLFVSMLDDPRVVLLKLADRLHNLRTMAAMSPAQREVKSRETLDIFAPLAGRIGLYLYKMELEDLAFSYTQPEEYARIKAQLREEERRRAGWAQRMCERMQRELAARGLVAAVNWRMKSPYSAYRDTRQSGLDVSLLDDVIAFRVIVSTVPQCYQSMGVIHHLWPPYPDAFHDYIAAPKVNGYQSLHTAVFALDNRLAQLHIRTHEMHRASQHGVALRWLEVAATGDAEVGTSALAVKRANLWVRQIEAWRKEMQLSAKEFVDTIKGEMFEDQVFISTPKGDVLELPLGSTVLDLAYRIHTRLGDRTVGARILSNNDSGMLVTHDAPPSYTLRTGDVVRVLSDPGARPQPEWLGIVRTRYAAEKIARSLRAIARGKDYEHTPRLPDHLEVAAQDVSEDASVACKGDAQAQVDALSNSTSPFVAAPAGGLQRPSGKQAQVHLARCCYPIPGDRISGVVERGYNVTVHRTCCLIFRATLARRQARGAAHAAALPLTWEAIQQPTYLLRLAIYGQDHPGLMLEVMERITQLGLNVTYSDAIANPARNKAAIVLVIRMPLGMRRETVLRQLGNVPGVTQVARETSKGCAKGEE